MMSAHQKEIVELTKYHDVILEDSHRQFHEAVRQNINVREPLDGTVAQPKPPQGSSNTGLALVSTKLTSLKDRFTDLSARRSSTEV